jgi:DNA polymerase I-like protein with 3'-5' exonuclease and polymerase domains
MQNLVLQEGTQRLLDIEIGVTAILFDIERLGMRTEPHMLRALNVYYIAELLRIEKQIEVATGYSIRPHVNDDCYDLLCNHFGLPVLRWTVDEDTKEEKNPSFAKDVLFEYLTYPGAPAEIVRLLLQYREMNTFRTLFLDTYLRLNLDGRLHPDINQTVRTGRMSVRRPNSQQLNKTAKKLILPDTGFSFLSIKAYNENPDTDFHQWVADMVHIKRRPAKTVNFCIGYGGGKKRLITLLMKEPELVAELLAQYKDPETFNAAAAARAEYVYNSYHRALPTLKTTSRAAEMRCRSRGYVFNLFGRRRHLPSQACHRAFNALNQSTAADILKERLIPVWEICKANKVRITALVHDEFLFHGEHAAIRAALPELIECLEQPEVQLSVPLRCSYGISDKSWWAAGESELKWPLEESRWHHARMNGGGR